MAKTPKSDQPTGSSQRPKRPVRPFDATEDLVLTPGGPRPRSRVYRLQPGEHVSTKGGRVRIIKTATGEVVKDLGEAGTPGTGESAPTTKLSSTTPGISDIGWIENSQWHNTGSDPIIYFSTTWVVPPAPSSSDNQTIFLFNGMQPDSGAHILQPVLQWGKSYAGGGSYWSITNWYADGQGGASVIGQALIQVNPGDVLQGVMTCTGKTTTASGTEYNYKSSFVGHPTADVTQTDSPELTWAYETLECYGANFNLPLTQCSDYPNTQLTAMYDIEIKTGTPGSSGTDATIEWFKSVNFTDCGQNCVIVSNNSPGGEVDLYYKYHTWFLVHNEVKMQPGATVTALWRSNDTHLDLFATGNDGAVWSTWWESQPGWQPWFLVHNEVKMQPGVTVTALWRSNETHLDLFATGNDGAVWSTWWESQPGWQPWFLVHNEVKMQRGATVTALWRSTDAHLDLFATGNDGAVWSTWWESQPGWQPWFLVHNEVKMQPGVTVTALWRSNDTHLDLFATGNDGAVWSTWWESQRGWLPWFLVHNEVKMQPGATVTALWRSNETHLDLFATGNDGAVWSTWWESQPGWQRWFLVDNEVKMQRGATVSALWRSNDTHLDLFATGNDGAVWSTWWESQPGWQPWFLVHNDVKMQPGATVTALWRSNDTHLDLFATGNDGAVWSIWWEASAGW